MAAAIKGGIDEVTEVEEAVIGPQPQDSKEAKHRMRQ